MDKTVQKIPFLRLSAALSTGVLVGSVIQPAPFLFLTLLLFLLIVLSGLNRYYHYQVAIYWGICFHLTFIVAGMLVFDYYNRKPVFYDEGKFSATVIEMMQEKPNSYQSLLKVNAFFQGDSVFETSEKMMVWFAKSENSRQLEPGQNILFAQKPQTVKNYNNPFEFDYKSYLARKKIYRQVYLPEDSWVKSSSESAFSVTIFAEKLRMHLLEIYQRQNMGEKELQVLSALTLGYKRSLDPETKQVFASAGAMHVLAVSGLHVGIVFLVLSFVFGFLKRQKTGRYIFVLLVVLALWCFAFITGLSPSVQRAATMFTFVVVGDNLKRRSNIYNTLAASAFFLLLLNPNNLFEAGFQLSYCAVFGIVFLQPGFEKLLTFRSKFLRYFWSLLTVSVAAQIATFPVSVFYFNQFPVYFWIANLLVIPAAIVLIPLGMALLAFYWIPLFPFAVSTAITFLLKFLIGFLQWIEKMPLSVVEFSFSELELAFVFGILLSFFFFIETRRKLYFKGILISFLLLQTISFVTKSGKLLHKEMIVYNHPDQLVIHLVAGKRNYIVSEEKLPDEGIAKKMVGKTVLKLRLDEPVFLTSGQTFSDDYLCLKNKILVFDERIIGLQTIPKPFLEKVKPAIVIDPPVAFQLDEPNLPAQTVVFSRKYPNRKVPGNSPVFYLAESGAFREKW